mgnify:CR=1 FL=1
MGQCAGRSDLIQEGPEGRILQALQIEPEMAFGSRLAPAVFGPIHARGDEVNHRGIDDVDDPGGSSGRGRAGRNRIGAEGNATHPRKIYECDSSKTANSLPPRQLLTMPRGALWDANDLKKILSQIRL